MVVNSEKYLIAFNQTSGRRLAEKVSKAEDYESRSRGLLGKTGMEPSEGLWIAPCPMIHTFFMKFPIDVLFLSRDLKVLRVMENLKPWRLSPWVFRAHSVLELAGGALQGSVKVGDQLKIS